MKKLFEIKNWWEMKNGIICGNCLDGLKLLPDNSVNLIVTDPPYSVGTTSTGNKGDWLDNNLIEPFFDKLFREFKRVLKHGGEVYINTDWRTYPFLFPILQKYFDIRNCIVWDYEWIKAGSHYRFSHEFIIYCVHKDSPAKRKFGGGERDVWRIKPINFTATKNHQAEKPLDLIKKCIENSSREGELVLDAFMGSWTTARACRDLGRNFIGFEISEAYCEVGEGRLRQENLF